MNDAPITPAQNEDIFVLEAPKPITTLNVQQAQTTEKPLAKEDTDKLDSEVHKAVSSILSQEVHGADFRKSVELIANIGSDEIRRASSASNRLLEGPINKIEDSLGNKSTVVKDMLTIRSVLDKINPDTSTMLGKSQGFLAKLPFNLGGKIVDKKRSYESSKEQIDAIVVSFYRGKDNLLRNIAAIDNELNSMWEMRNRLKKFAYVAEKIDADLCSQIETLGTTDKERATILKEEVLFRLREKRQDLATSIAANTFGYMVLDRTRLTHNRAIIGIDRVTTTTLDALRISLMAMQAAQDERTMIDATEGMGDMAGRYMVRASEAMLENTKDLVRLSTMPSINPEAIAKAFDNAYKASEQFSSFRVNSLETIKKNTDALNAQTEKAEQFMTAKRNEILEKPLPQKALTFNVD